MSLSLIPVGSARALRILCVALLAVVTSALIACRGKADPPQPLGGECFRVELAAARHLAWASCFRVKV